MLCLYKGGEILRYKLDWNGYVSAVAFGCYLDNCTEYKGEIPIGYSSLDEWATNACVNAYYLDSSGNLVIDYEKLAEIKRKEAQQAVDNAPLLRKDLYESEEILDSQYIKATASGEVITLDNIQTIIPRVKITGIQPYNYGQFEIFTNGKNLMPFDAVTVSYSGMTFTRYDSGLLNISGRATEDIEYNVSGSMMNEEVLFAMKKGKNYHLNLGGLSCEMRHTMGELTKQKYAGASGVINLSQSIEVTQVLIKIPKGTTVYKSFYPQLEYGTSFTSYEPYKKKSTLIDFSKYVVPRGLYLNNNVYPSDTLYPNSLTYFTDTSIEYILLENGVIYASIDGIKQVIGSGSVGLYSAYDTIYATQDAALEIEYSTNVYDVDNLDFMREKKTTSEKFIVLKDGSIEAYNGYFKGGKVELNASSDDSGLYVFGTRYTARYDDDGVTFFFNGTKCYTRMTWNGFESGTYTGTTDNPEFYPSTSLESTLGEDPCLVVNASEFPSYIYGLEVVNLYNQSSASTSSDRYRKCEEKELDLQKSSDFIYSLKPKQYKYKNGTSDRLHHGFIAQDVKESMGTEDWGLYVDYNPEEAGNKALRYEELIADLVATIQQQNKRITQLEERIGDISE